MTHALEHLEESMNSETLTKAHKRLCMITGNQFITVLHIVETLFSATVQLSQVLRHVRTWSMC